MSVRATKETKEIKEKPKVVKETKEKPKKEKEVPNKDVKDTKESRVKEEVATDPKIASKRDVYYTPEYAFEIIAAVIRDFKSIWDPAAGAETHPVKAHFEKLGHRVIASDILEGPENDFLTTKTKKRYDMIVTTPPYDLRKEFIQRACDLNKPFALLVPVNVLESRTIRDLLKQKDISIIFPAKTVTFTSPVESRSVKTLPYSIWLVHGVERLPPVLYQ